MIKRLPNRLVKMLRSTPHRRGLVAGLALITTGLLIGGLQNDEPVPFAEATEIRPIALPARSTGDPSPSQSPVARWQEDTIRSGGSLGALFDRNDLPGVDLHALIASEGGDVLKRVYPGQRIQFEREPAGSLIKLKTETPGGDIIEARRAEDGFRVNRVAAEYQTRLVEASGVITRSFSQDGDEAGLRANTIMNVAKIFGWDIDFALDLRAGDRFHVIYEKLYRNGEYVRDGDVIAATFINRGDEYQAIAFDTGETLEYFAPDGRNMRKAFLRAPLDFTRVSSRFNPNRLHPVLKTRRPHNGIDYAAPTGTPVYAAGAGQVIRSGYSKYNGHHVFIDHPNGVTTRYLHFTKTAVKKGARVKQGQVIGYVGATGLASGPHLHYEFLVNGRHRNPGTVKLPKSEPLRGDLLAAFQAKANPLLRQLDRLEGNLMLASNTGSAQAGSR